MSVFHIGELRPKPEHADALIASLEMLKEQPGYISHACYRNSEDPLYLSTIEEWETKADHDTFMQSMPKEALDGWMNMLSEPPKSSFFEKL